MYFVFRVSLFPSAENARILPRSKYPAAVTSYRVKYTLGSQLSASFFIPLVLIMQPLFVHLFHIYVYICHTHAISRNRLRARQSHKLHLTDAGAGEQHGARTVVQINRVARGRRRTPSEFVVSIGDKGSSGTFIRRTRVRPCVRAGERNA